MEIKINMLKLAGLFYCFSIAFAASTGSIIVKSSRIILVIAFILNIIRKPKIKIDCTFFEKWTMLFFCFCCGSTLWTVSFTNTSVAILSLLYIVVCNFILIYILKQDELFIYDILKSNVIGAVMHGFNIFLNYGFNIYFTSRGGSIVENANTIGFVSCFAFIYCFILLSNKKIKNKLLYVVLSIISLVWAILSASRKILIYLIVFFIPYYILKSKNISKKIAKICLSILIVSGIYYVIMNNTFLYEILGVRIESAIAGLLGARTDGSTAFRLKLIDWGLDWFSVKPILGYGLNSFKHLLGVNYNTWAGINGVYAHNNYVELLVNLGLVGTIIYYIMYIKIIYDYFKLKNKTKKALVSICMILCIMIAEYGQVTYSIAFFQEIILIAYFYFFMTISENLEKVEINNDNK